MPSKPVLGESVVWLRDGMSPGYGFIRWFEFRKELKDYLIGVEFTDPVGNCDGNSMDGHQHFHTRAKHAQFIPGMSLIKAEEYMENETNVKKEPNNVCVSTNVTNLTDSFEHIEANSVLTPLKPVLGERVVWLRDGGPPEYGFIRWFEFRKKLKDYLVGVEFTNPVGNCDGKSMNGHQQLFHTRANHARFIPGMSLISAEKYLENETNVKKEPNNACVSTNVTNLTDSFEHIEADSVKTVHVANAKSEETNDKKHQSTYCSINMVDRSIQHFGINQGIQGHQNSCYLDATLFGMFAFTDVFDSLLHRPRRSSDIPEYADVQAILRDGIVKPLRSSRMFVAAETVMQLRELLDLHSNVTGLTSEEKDPEEFLNSLLQQILKANPFLKLNSGQDSYYYQLFVEKDETIALPTTQQLFERSFLASNLKLNAIPSCLIIQMPRFGRHYKTYHQIYPSQQLDITDVLANSPRSCGICSDLAEYECRECFNKISEGLDSTCFCSECNVRMHSHSERQNHAPDKLQVPTIAVDHFLNRDVKRNIPRVKMELFAVICIATSHYVTFAKIDNTQRWVFFDSMADRIGEEDGYNVPEVKSCINLPYWLTNDGYKAMKKNSNNVDKDTRRLLSDCFVCMYENHTMKMYT